MLGHAAARLVLDVDKAITPCGFWAVAAIFGDLLVQRRKDHSELSFELVSELQV